MLLEETDSDQLLKAVTGAIELLPLWKMPNKIKQTKQKWSRIKQAFSQLWEPVFLLSLWSN